jgi:valyl-tRNA synthetase
MTEKIWQIINSNLPETLNKFKNEKSVMSSSYPTNSKSTNNTEEIDYLIKIIKSIRNIRSELKIAHKHMLKIHVSDKSVYSELLEHSDVLLNLSKSEIITSKPTNNFPIAVENTILDIEIPGELSIPDEIDRIKSEIIEIQQRILPLEKRIKSPSFYNNAPKEIVVKEKERLTDQKNRILQLEEILKSIS